MSQPLGTKIASASANVLFGMPSPDPLSHRNWAKKLGNNPRYATIQSVKAMRVTDSPGSRKVAISARKADNTTAAKVPSTQGQASRPQKCAGQLARIRANTAGAQNQAG